MFQMRLAPEAHALTPFETAAPAPGPSQIRLKVRACGVCRTDLHVLDGDLPLTDGPRVLGHEVVGVVDAVGRDVTRVRTGDRVGIPWLARTCGRCRYCLAGLENLCDAADFTGWTVDGGFADTIVAEAEAALPIPDGLTDQEAAPLLCAGLIGYRSWRMACEAAAGGVRSLGLYGFGAAAHLLAQLAIAKGQTVYAFARPDDQPAMDFARSLGCAWAGPSDQAPPDLLDAAIIFAPDGALVPRALAAVRKGGAVVCGGIHMSDIPSFPYDLLWGERKLLSVANLQRRDGAEYLPLAVAAGVRAHVTPYALDQANQALHDLRCGHLTGAAVLVPEAPRRG
jgi:propanol-preferring alcohol dehydrogenase